MYEKPFTFVKQAMVRWNHAFCMNFGLMDFAGKGKCSSLHFGIRARKFRQQQR